MLRNRTMWLEDLPQQAAGPALDRGNLGEITDPGLDDLRRQNVARAIADGRTESSLVLGLMVGAWLTQKER